MMNTSVQPIRIEENCSVQSVLRLSSPRMEFVVIINNIPSNECGSQFVENPSGRYRNSEETHRFVDRLLLEKLSQPALRMRQKFPRVGFSAM